MFVINNDKTKSPIKIWLSGPEQLEESCLEQAYQVTNHHFKWWFELTPQGAFVTCTPERRELQALLLATARKRLLHYLLFLILLPALLYTSVQLHQ